MWAQRFPSITEPFRAPMSTRIPPDDGDTPGSHEPERLLVVEYNHPAQSRDLRVLPGHRSRQTGTPDMGTEATVVEHKRKNHLGQPRPHSTECGLFIPGTADD